MKPSTKHLRDLINTADTDIKISKLPDFLSDSGQPMLYQESDFSEVIIKYEEIADFINSDNWELILDSLPKSKREVLSWYIQNTINFASYIKQSQFNYVQNFIDQLEGLYDVLYVYLSIPEKSKLQAERQEVWLLKAEYKKMSIELLKLLKNKEKAWEFIEQINEIETKLTELSNRETHIREMEQDIENKKLKINDFGNDIDQYTQDITSWKSDIETLKTEYKEAIDKYNSIASSVDQRSQTLLNLVTEWSLWQHFSTKEKNIITEKYLTYFFLSIVIGIIFVFLAFQFIEIIGASKLELFLIRFSVFLPFFGAAWVFYSEYSFHKNLKEKYSFRSILALSLRSFSDIISNHTDSWTKRFIENSINQIFESPLEAKWWISKKLSEQVIEKSLEKALNVWERIVDKSISE